MPKKKLAVKRDPSTKNLKWKRMALTGVFLILFSVGGFFAYQYKQVFSFVIYMSYLKTWVVEHRSHLRENLVKAKQFASQKPDNEQQIHFKFYSTLLNMQVANETLQVDESRNIDIKEKLR